MERSGLWARWRHRFDNTLSKGPLALFGRLIVTLSFSSCSWSSFSPGGLMQAPVGEAASF